MTFFASYILKNYGPLRLFWGQHAWYLSKAGLRIRICIRVKTWIRMRIRVKSWIRIRIENRSFRGSTWSRGGSEDQWSQILITLVRRRIRIQRRIRFKWKTGSGSVFKWCRSATLDNGLLLALALKQGREWNRRVPYCAYGVWYFVFWNMFLVHRTSMESYKVTHICITGTGTLNSNGFNRAF
jgi:hypothetical protein